MSETERIKSTNKVEVVPLVLKPAPNSDSLSIIQVYGYNVIGKTEVWQDVTQAAYVPPDSLLDTRRPEFASFNDGKTTLYYEDGLTQKEVKRDELPTYARIRIKKIRGNVSTGMLLPAPAGSKIGDDVTELFGVKHWNPPEHGNGSNEVASGPPVYTVKYDVDSFKRYASEVFVEGEPVFVTEKIHGENARFVYTNGEFYCGSRTEWKKEFPTPPNPEEIEKDIRAKSKGTPEEIEERVQKMKDKILARPLAQNKWWRALRNHPKLMEWLQSHPDVVVYGELYGGIGGFPYDREGSELKIGVFDIMNEGRWMDPVAARLAAPELPWVPTLAEAMPYNFDKLVDMAQGMSTLNANHIREGVVVSPIKERNHESIGRVKLKIVSDAYLEGKK